MSIILAALLIGLGLGFDGGLVGFHGSLVGFDDGSVGFEGEVGGFSVGVVGFNGGLTGIGDGWFCGERSWKSLAPF